MPLKGFNPENRDAKNTFKIKYLRGLWKRKNGALKQERRNTAS
jgi:hypothetical protein